MLKVPPEAAILRPTLAPPRLRSDLPQPRNVLPRLRSVLPRLRSAPPRLRSVRPQPLSVLPLPLQHKGRQHRRLTLARRHRTLRMLRRDRRRRMYGPRHRRLHPRRAIDPTTTIGLLCPTRRRRTHTTDQRLLPRGDRLSTAPISAPSSDSP